MVSTDLSTWDINPKSGVGLPLTITVDGYLAVSGLDDETLDGETVTLQIDWGGGDFHDTMLSMVTGYNPDTNRHGYFSGTVALTVEGGNGIWVYAPGTYYFRSNYVGNSSKDMSGVTSPIISVTDTPPLASGAHAYIYGIRQQDVSTGVWYYIFPEGQQGYCNSGATFSLFIGIQNNGTEAGTLYIKITRLDTGQLVLNREVYLAVGGQQPYSFAFTMPSHNVALRVEIGHY